MRWLVFTVLFLALLSGACVSPNIPYTNESRLYEGALEDLGMPHTTQGEMDTMWEYFMVARKGCGDNPTLCDLYEYAAVDVYLADLLAGFVNRNANELAFEDITTGRFQEIQNIVNEHHTAWLRQVVEQYGWFTKSEDGDAATIAAFFLLQHTSDTSLQKQLIPTLVELAEAEEIAPADVAMLVDRVAIKEGAKQIYGTQGRCVGNSEWMPFPVSAPEFVESERSMMKLGSLAEYKQKMGNSYCRNFGVSSSEP